MTDAAENTGARPAADDTGGLRPRSLRTGLLWIGWVLVVVLLLTPTLGSHGPGARSYEGESFSCPPALGPGTSHLSNIWEEWPEEWAQDPAYGVPAAKYTRHEAESVFRVAVCGEQRSRRVAWALVVAIPTLAIALTGRRSAVPVDGGRAAPRG